MAKSSKRQIAIKTVLILIVLWGLVFGIPGLLFTHSMMESFMPDVPFNNTVDSFVKGISMAMVTWAIAAIIALRNLQNRALLQAIIAGWGLFSLEGLFSDLIIMKAGASVVAIDGVMFILALALLAFYPWGQKSV